MHGPQVRSERSEWVDSLNLKESSKNRPVNELTMKKLDTVFYSQFTASNHVIFHMWLDVYYIYNNGINL